MKSKKKLPQKVVGLITVLELIEDGAKTIMKYSPDDVFINFVKKRLKLQKKPTTRQLNKFVKEMLEKAVEGKDGYSYRSETLPTFETSETKVS